MKKQEKTFAKVNKQQESNGLTVFTKKKQWFMQNKPVLWETWWDYLQDIFGIWPVIPE